jgi:diguanylate cyclase (GGDEF)-like protein/PAS domain S-box-containing protein
MTEEKQIGEIFEGATRSFTNTLLSQIQEGVYCLDRDRRIVLWNKGAETITGLERSEVLGKQCPEDVVLLVDHEGHSIDAEKCPTIATLKDGTIRSAKLYIRHKDGYRLPVFLRVIPVFKEDGEIIGTAEIFTDTSPKVTIPLNVNELERMALIDTETGITNRKYLEMHLAARLDEFQKYNLPFGLIYADVDHYNKILERYARFNAAKVLRMIARTVHKNIRYFDIVGRWNTEEFLIVLLNLDETRVDIVANKLRLLVAESYISVETGVLSATISMGACLVQRYDTVESLVKRAEQLMMHSKWRGRNKVSMSFVQDGEQPQ